MKIAFDTGINRIGKSVKLNRKIENESDVKTTAVKKTRVYDEIMLSSRESREPQDIIEDTRKKTTFDVLSETPANDLNDIKRQIMNGSYDANVSQITGKMLFDIM